MAGSALRDRPRKAAFIARLMAAGRDLDDAAITALAEEMARGINQIWLWDNSIESCVPPGANTQKAPAAKPAADANLPVPEPTADEAFDPFAFSVVVLLKRQGRAALMKRLDAIDDPAQLHKIAEAQHLGIDKSLKSARKLREAIIVGAEQRLADRRAAAS